MVYSVNVAGFFQEFADFFRKKDTAMLTAGTTYRNHQIVPAAAFAPTPVPKVLSPYATAKQP